MKRSARASQIRKQMNHARAQRAKVLGDMPTDELVEELDRRADCMFAAMKFQVTPNQSSYFTHASGSAPIDMEALGAALASDYPDLFVAGGDGGGV